MDKDTALRLALEALVMLLDNYVPEATEEDISQVETTITAIKAALEAKDEPVAWMYEVNHAHTCLDLFEPPDDAYDEGTLYPLYTTPPQRTWVGLMRGVRVDGDTVVISVKGDNDEARKLCGALIEEMNK